MSERRATTLRTFPAVPGLLLVVVMFVAGTAGAQKLPGLPGDDAPEATPARSVPVESSAATDRAVAKRLREIYGHVEGLENVQVDVNAGVVALSGEILSATAGRKAEGIARQLEGVVEVQSDFTEVRDVERRLRPALALVRERMLSLLARLPLLIVALLMFLAVAALGRLVTAWERPYRRLVRNRFVGDLLIGAIRAAALLAGLVLALRILDATAIVATVAGFAGLAGVALSFAFRDLAENYIASVLLSMRQPFLPNDQIQIAGYEGRVVRLTSRATTLMDLAGNHVRIPNATVFKQILVNLSRNPRRRFDFTVGVTTDADLGRAIALGTHTLDALPGVLQDPEPVGWIDALGDSTVTLHFFGWVDQRQAEWVKVRSESIRVVKEAFDAAGIVMPEPIVNVRPLEAAEPHPAQPSAPEAPRLEIDISPDTALDREIAEDRAGDGDDLLDPEAQRE